MGHSSLPVFDPGPTGFVDHARMTEWLAAKAPDHRQKLDLIAKAREAKGLAPQEVAALLAPDPAGAQDIWPDIFTAARKVKEAIYGTRLVLFAPLYVSNHCLNNCLYCGYRVANTALSRRRLTETEIQEEVLALLAMGHKRLALEAGESPRECPLDYVIDAIRVIYETRSPDGRGAIRRVNVNVAATTASDYRRLAEAGIGTYILFQETYHRPTYDIMHPSGPKSDYLWHLHAMERAMEGGIDDVGLGALFGLYDWRFEVLALLLHAQHLESTCGVGPHTISVPRLRPAAGVEFGQFPYLVGDEDFRRLVAVLRLAVPYAGMILSTRERPGFRDEVLGLGISQISAGSRAGVGGYRENVEATSHEARHATAQFSLEDQRDPDEIVHSLVNSGYIPSYCTACYRQGRTGDRFMSLAKAGRIKYLCLPNALLTFKEYLLDYASPPTRVSGEKAITTHLGQIDEDGVRAETIRRLARLEAGERDIYF